MKATAPLSRSLAKHSRRGRPLALPKLNGGITPSVKSSLVAVDFSPPSMKALRYAATLARVTGAHLTLENVMEVVDVPDFTGDRFTLPRDEDEAVEQRRGALKCFAAGCGCPPDMLSGIKIRKGAAFQEITSAARALKMDLIVVAAHGYTGVKRVLLGSTAERVIRPAACPVLVVPARS